MAKEQNSLKSLSDRLWSGEISTHERDHHPFLSLNVIEEITPRVAFYKGFSNITAVKTAEGVVLIDTGSFHPVAQARSFEKIRSWTKDRVHTAIYTHGHVDHAYGLPPFLEEAKAEGWDAPWVLAHEAVQRRMDRYIETAGYNSVINERQFGVAIEWPTDPVYPNETYVNDLRREVGEQIFMIRHAEGETDDHTWVYLPSEKVLCTGDLFIWAAPNAGNPQKVQRFVKEWAEALMQMAELDAEVLLPGHGVPIYGPARVREALWDTAAYLNSIYQQTVALMNAGANIYDLIETVQPPDELAEKPYLQPIYDEPEFITRTVYRCLGGWYSGVPSDVKPAPRRDQALEIVSLAGGIESLLTRALKLVDRGDLRLACHLADWAVEADPENSEAHRVRAEVYEARTESEPSTMSKGIFGAAARESAAKAGSTESAKD